ncbi:MAG: DUF5312 domain-containing protein [Treponema sp.]|jgi:hypothetical protein|nr:DUF5312 domain-containing protein [Treponema sp.]
MLDSPLPSQEDKTLSRLVSDLSLDERNGLLEKLRGQTALSFEPMYEDRAEPEQGEVLEERYVRLPWYVRLRLFILGYLKSRPPIKVFEDSLVSKLGREIEAKAPGLYDYHKNLLLLGFFDLLTELKGAARFFFTALDTSVNRDKSGFYAFLGSLEIGELHHRLETETAPELFTDTLDTSERELRQATTRAMEDIFFAISDAKRIAMYSNARSLNCLMELASFTFDRIITAFGSSSGGQTCSVNASVRDLLINLNNILFSLKEPPALSLLESLFIYLLQERSGEPGFDINVEMYSLLARAEEAVSTIRFFNKKVPLTKIIRCASRDLTLAPQQISGGEDWFVIYREYWKKQIDSRVAGYMRRRKQRDLLDTFRHFLDGTNLKVLNNVVSEANPQGFPVPESFALSFLLTFHAVVFMNKINIFLRPILIDGEFFRKESRSVYTEAYDDIIKAGDDIRQFDLKIAHSGEYGMRYDQIKEEISSLQLKKRKLQQVTDEVSREAGGIIIRTRNAIATLINILTDMLKKGGGSKYDTLANWDKLGGKNLEAFLEGVMESLKQLQQALRILRDIDEMGN